MKSDKLCGGVVNFANLLDEENWSLDTRRSKVQAANREELHHRNRPATIENVLYSCHVEVWKREKYARYSTYLVSTAESQRSKKARAGAKPEEQKNRKFGIG